MPKPVELVFFEGCPNVSRARENLREALAHQGLPLVWTEWDQQRADVPGQVRGYGSPTVLVDNKDVTGASPVGGMALACRSDGAPTVAAIVAALE